MSRPRGLIVNAGSAGMGIPRGSVENLSHLNHQVAKERIRRGTAISFVLGITLWSTNGGKPFPEFEFRPQPRHQHVGACCSQLGTIPRFF